MTRTRRALILSSAVLVVLLGLVVLAQVMPRPVEAASDVVALETFTCTPAGVATFHNRVHVRCTTSAPGNIRYFAVCTSNSVTAARYLSVFTTAFAMNKNLTIHYSAADTSGTACGCQAGDCRVITGAEAVQ